MYYKIYKGLLSYNSKTAILTTIIKIFPGKLPQMIKYGFPRKSSYMIMHRAYYCS